MSTITVSTRTQQRLGHGRPSPVPSIIRLNNTQVPKGFTKAQPPTPSPSPTSAKFIEFYQARLIRCEKERHLSPSTLHDARTRPLRISSSSATGKCDTRPLRFHTARAIANSEERLTNLLFEGRISVLVRRRPSVHGRPKLPSIKEDQVYPPPPPPPAFTVHPMVRTKARRPRPRSSNNENQPLGSSATSQWIEKARNTRAVSYSMSRETLAQIGQLSTPRQ